MNSKLERIEELKHNEELLYNCINYLWEIWNNEDADTILKSFKKLGFTDKDFNRILDKILNDDELNAERNNTIHHYLYHYKKEEE